VNEMLVKPVTERAFTAASKKHPQTTAVHLWPGIILDPAGAGARSELQGRGTAQTVTAI